MRILWFSAVRLRACLLACAIALPCAASAQSVSYGVPSPALAELEKQTARAMRLYRAGETEASVQAFEAASAIAERDFGASNLKFIQSLNNLALIYDLSGQLVRAEKVYRQAIEIVESKTRAQPVQLANLRNNLAAVVLQQCRIGDAQALYKQALALSEKSLGPNHVDTRMTRANVKRLDRYLGATTSVSVATDDTANVGQMLQRCIS